SRVTIAGAAGATRLRRHTATARGSSANHRVPKGLRRDPAAIPRYGVVSRRCPARRVVRVGLSWGRVRTPVFWSRRSSLTNCQSRAPPQQPLKRSSLMKTLLTVSSLMLVLAGLSPAAVRADQWTGPKEVAQAAHGFAGAAQRLQKAIHDVSEDSPLAAEMQR